MPGFPSLSFWICMKHRLVHVQHCPLRGFFSRLSPKSQFGVGIYGSGAADWPQEPWALLLGRRAMALERHRVSESWGLTRTHLLLSAQLPPSPWQAGEKSYLYLGLRKEMHQLFFLLWWPNMWQEGVYLGLPSSESSPSCLGRNGDRSNEVASGIASAVRMQRTGSGGSLSNLKTHLPLLIHFFQQGSNS